MTAIQTFSSRSSSTSSQSTSMIQHSYLIAAVLVLFALVFSRIFILRWRNQTLSDFFRIGGNSRSGSRPPNDSNQNSMYYGVQLAPLPAAYRPGGRVCAADTDVHGRRLDPTEENWDGKDALPAYDNFDRPPKYVEASWTHGEPSLPTEQSVTTPSPERGQSEMTHPNTANGAPMDSANQPLDRFHAEAGLAHGPEVPTSPIYHDLSSS